VKSLLIKSSLNLLKLFIKNTNMRKILLCVSAAVMLLTACNKDEDEEPGPITPTVANLTGSYKITASTANGVNVFDNGNTAMNFYEPCMRDDVYTLVGNGSYTLTDAGTQCNPPGDDTGTWSLTNATTLNIDGSDWTINSWNGKTLVVSMSFQGATFQETYTRQ
jgi:hypothetical protein